jgi:phosphatidylethanolamine/phosphatidyl-N-methylethanolamine N-methyltransferase
VVVDRASGGGGGGLRDHIEFLRQYRQRFTTTGSIAPSSRFLARAMTGPLCERAGPRRILEIGPGTGAVTRRIVRLMRPEDRLDLVELNETFAGIVRRRFETDRHYQRVAECAELHVCPIQEFQSDGAYDVIISGLPINNFSMAMVRDVFEAYFRLLAPGGVLSYFEYMYMRPARKLVSGRATKERLNQLDGFLGPLLEKHRLRTSWVFVNLPPAWVQHLRPVGVPEAVGG